MVGPCWEGPDQEHLADQRQQLGGVEVDHHGELADQIQLADQRQLAD